MNIIRKISVGPDYMKCMHYTVGQKVLNSEYTIYAIKLGTEGYQVWIEREGEIICWKQFSNTMPVSVEYKIDF